MTIKGYVVRGTHETRGEIAAWSSDGSIGPRPGASLFRSLDDAAGARGSVVHRGCTDVRIFAVGEDGTETALHSYAEALAENERLRAERDAERKAWARLLDAEINHGTKAFVRATEALNLLGVDVDTLLAEVDS